MSSLLHSIWTVVLFVVFIGIIIWAYSSNRKKDFDEAAMLAVNDDDLITKKPVQEKEKPEEKV